MSCHVLMNHPLCFTSWGFAFSWKKFPKNTEFFLESLVFQSISTFAISIGHSNYIWAKVWWGAFKNDLESNYKGASWIYVPVWVSWINAYICKAHVRDAHASQNVHKCKCCIHAQALSTWIDIKFGQNSFWCFFWTSRLSFQHPRLYVILPPSTRPITNFNFWSCIAECL